MNNDVSWYTKENYEYIKLYTLKKIGIKDVPIMNLNDFILSKAMKIEPDVVIELLFTLYEEGNRSFDILKYIVLHPDRDKRDEYYYRYFLLNPVLHYSKLLSGRNKTTKEMANYLFDLDPSNIQYLLDKQKDRFMCDKALKHDIDLFVYIPSGMLNYDMCLLYINSVASTIYVDIDDAVNNTPSENMFKYFPKFNRIPKQYYSFDLFNLIFQLNPKLFVTFPSWVLTYEMCDKAYDVLGNKIRNFVPSSVLFRIESKRDTVLMSYNEKQEYYYEKFKEDPLLLFEYVPLEYRTQKIYDLYFEVGKDSVFDSIPLEYRTEKMWIYMVKISADPKILAMIPQDKLTQRLCDCIYQLYGMNSLSYIPYKYVDKNLLGYLLEHNLYDLYYNDLKIFALDLNDTEFLGKLVIYLKKMIHDRKTVDADFQMVELIVKLYPYLLKAFSLENVDKIITKELYSLIYGGGTLEGVASKYDLSISYVNSVLDNISKKDITSYNLIKEVLSNNQNKWLATIKIDVVNLDMIINMLGEIKDNKLSMKQKCMFSYLYLRYIHHSLEEIYNFNYEKHMGGEYSLITNFFRRILKYDFLYKDDMTMVPEKKTIMFNNGWLKPYDRDSFFAIKDGKMTMEHRYGKDSRLLTLDIEKNIVDELKINNIPLNSIIVQNAFREYFNGTLNEYIKEFVDYDLRFDNNKGRGGK